MKTSVKIFHWMPRILCILAILLISMFAFDSFSPERTFWQNLGAFMMHLLPTFVLIALLIAAWKWELAGGIAFAVIGLALSPIIYSHNFNMNHSAGKSLGAILIVTMPFIIVGLLFIVSYFLKKKQNSIVK
jgi:cytochrome b561